MAWEKTVLLGLLVGAVLSAGAYAQVPVRPAPGTTAGQRPATGQRTRREPCWQVAGVSQTVWRQRLEVERQTRVEVEGVCANNSLSPAQKHEQIRQLRERERQQLEGLITPAQKEAMQACRQKRGHTTVAGVGAGHGAHGPCGEMSGHRPFAEGDEDERAPNETPNPSKEPPKPN